MVPEPSMWGWAFLNSGFPCVAHLVWPMPTVPGIFSSLRLFIKFFSLPSALLQVILFVSELIIAIPAESYPLYSSFSKPFINNGKAFL